VRVERASAELLLLRQLNFSATGIGYRDRNYLATEHSARLVPELSQLIPTVVSCQTVDRFRR